MVLPGRSALATCLLSTMIVGCGKSAPVAATKPPTPPPGMVLIPGGSFLMGSNTGNPDEKPVHPVAVSSFYLDIHEVTNDQFAKFVQATGYKTVAERPLDPKDFPGVPKAKLVPGAAVFATGKGWTYVPGASWRRPEGPNSSIAARGSHPVVQVAWEDAQAFAKWAGKRLPTEAEWEYAGRSGTKSLANLWGDEAFDDQAPQANIWQGAFPTKNDNTDGFLTTAPIKSFKPNPFGLYDMGGNVWEWCSDWYRPDAYGTQAETDPKGPQDSYDPDEPETPKRVVRGGSFLCADCSCRGYRPSARMKSSPDTGLYHTGFRCAMDAPSR